MNNFYATNTWPKAATLLYEIVGMSDASVREQVEVVRKIASLNGCIENQVLTDSRECQEMWKRFLLF